MRKIIITESQLNQIKGNNSYIENNNSEVFNKEVRKFLYCIMKDEKENISDYWGINNITKIEIFKLLKRAGVIQKTPDGSILVPKKNFDKKVDRVYYELFNEEPPDILISEDDGGGISDGATTCASSGSYETPFGQVQRRKIANITN